MKSLLQILYFGYGILLFAFVINVLSKTLGLKSWYDVFTGTAFRDLSSINIIYLVVLYPLLLGVSILLLDKLKAILFK